jgi:hypothetical protein
MKEFGSELVAAGKIVEEGELMGYILNGLDDSYNSLVSSVNANPDTTLDDFFGQICVHDMHREVSPRHAMTSARSTPLDQRKWMDIIHSMVP